MPQPICAFLSRRARSRRKINTTIQAYLLVTLLQVNGAARGRVPDRRRSPEQSPELVSQPYKRCNGHEHDRETQQRRTVAGPPGPQQRRALSTPARYEALYQNSPSITRKMDQLSCAATDGEPYVERRHQLNEVSANWLAASSCDLTNQRKVTLQVRFGRPYLLVGLIATQPQLASV